MKGHLNVYKDIANSRRMDNVKKDEKEKGFMEDDEKVLSEEEEAELKEKLKYYGYI